MEATYEEVIDAAKIIEKVISMQDNPNPYKGESFIATYTLYKMYEGKYMHCCRKLDFMGEYHWWIYYDDGIVKDHIDMTRKQYYIEGEECPSDNKRGVGIADRPAMGQYKKRIDELRNKVDAYKESLKHG